MNCDNCGIEVPEGAVYCPKCGDRLDRRMSAEDAAAEARAEAGSSTAADSSATATQPKPDGGADRLRDTARTNRNGGNGHDDEAEADLWQGGYSAKAMLGHWVGAVIISVLLLIGMVVFPALASPIGWLVFALVLLLLWGAIGILLAYRRMNVYYQLTTQRFIHRSGVLRRTTDRIEVIDIDDVTFEQGLVERMTGVGTIKIISSDRSHPELLLSGIDDVQQVADQIDSVRRAERRKRGLHIEAI